MFYGIVIVIGAMHQFKEVEMKKKFAVAMAITAGLCFAGSGQVKPAFAGYWEVESDPALDSWGNPPPPWDPNYSQYLAWQADRLNGTATTSGVYNGQNYSFSKNWQEDDPYLTNCGFVPAGLTYIIGPGNSGAISSTGKIRVLFHWVRDQINGVDDTTDNPPPVLNVQVHLHANAIQHDGDENASNVNLETSVGIENGESYSGNTELNYDYGSAAYSSDIVKFISVPISTVTPTGGHDRFWSPWFTFNAQAQADIPSNITDNWQGEHDINLSFYYQLDNRYIEIASDDIEPSNRKENGIQTPNLRDGNGAITVDRAVTYGTYPDLQAPLDIYSSVAEFDLQSDLLGTNPVGFTDPTYDWTFVGGTNLLSHPVTTDEDFPFFLGLRLAGSNSTVPTTSAALTVTDGADGRQFINHYTIRWHDQAEWDLNNYDLIGTNDDKQIWNYFQPDPGSQNRTFCVSGGTGISADYTFENFYNRLIAQSSGDVVEAGTVLLANYVGVEAVPPLALLINKLAGSAGVAATQEVQDYLGGSSTTNQEVSFDSVWDINAVYADDPNDPDDQNVNVIPDFETPKFWAENANGELVQISRPMINGFADDSAATKTHFELCNPQYAKKYEPRKYHGDAYGSHGYIGPTDKGADVKVPGSRLTGEFYPDNWHTDHGQS